MEKTVHTFIYTKSLDNADDTVVKALDYEDENDAVECFNEIVRALVAEALDNKFLNFKMSMHKRKALIQTESTHHCVAVVKDGGSIPDEW